MGVVLDAAEEAEYKKIIKKIRAEAIDKREEFQARIDSQGGVFLLKGLYHGERRVRATDDGDAGWELSEDEVDLISAIGRKTIKNNANPVDLRNKWGLKERREYAPVKAVIDGEYARIIRADEWGEACELANLSFKERLKWAAMQSSMKEWLLSLLLLLLLPHFVLLIIAQKHVSSLMWDWISASGLVALLLLPAIFPGLIKYDGVPEFLNNVINLYLYIPIGLVFAINFIRSRSSY